MKARNALAMHYRYLVIDSARIRAASYPRSLTSQDLETFGDEGLLIAIKKYDPNRRVAFTSYAEHRIRGAIQDGMRRWDHVRRRSRQIERMHKRTRSQLTQTLGRWPTDDEMADALGRGPVRYRVERDAVLAAELQPLAVAVYGQQDAGPRPDSVMEGRDTWQRLMRGCSRVERIILTCYYSHGLTMKSIANLLELSESRVSQVHGHLLARLRETWKGTELCPSPP